MGMNPQRIEVRLVSALKTCLEAMDLGGPLSAQDQLSWDMAKAKCNSMLATYAKGDWKSKGPNPTQPR